MPELRIEGHGDFLGGDKPSDPPCVWCRAPSSTSALAPGLGRELPLHVFCAGAVIVAYRRFVEGKTLSNGQVLRLRGYLRLLPGSE